MEEVMTAARDGARGITPALSKVVCKGVLLHLEPEGGSTRCDMELHRVRYACSGLYDSGSNTTEASGLVEEGKLEPYEGTANRRPT
jgi:hypothetical protein